MVRSRDYNEPPPNGGYGWVVVWLGHVCLIIAAGIISSFGLFLPRIMDDFDEVSGATVSLITSACAGIAFGSGLCAFV